MVGINVDIEHVFAIYVSIWCCETSTIEHTTASFRSNFLPSTKAERQREGHIVLPLNKLLPELE